MGEQRHSAYVRAGGYFADFAAAQALRRGEVTARGRAFRDERYWLRVYGGRKASHRSSEAASGAEGRVALGRVFPEMASVDERDHLLARHRGESGHARWQENDADFLRFELPGGNLRLLRHAHQRKSED